MGESRVVIPIFGILDVTGEVIGMWVVLAAVTVISLLATRHMRERPGKFQNVIETGVEYLDNYFAGILGKKESRKHFLFLGSLFIFIIFGNYTGLIPGAGLPDYGKAPTSSLSVTLGLGIITFFYLQGSSIHARGFLGYLKRFISPIAIMLPLLLLDEFIKPASLALRLFGNIFGEETVTEQLYEILPIGAPIVMMVLSLLFCALGLLSAVLCFAMVARVYLARANRAPVAWGGALSRKETAKLAAAVLAVIAAVVVTEVTKP